MKTNNFPTNLSFISIQVNNMEESKKFYSEVLGFELDKSPNDHAVVFKSKSGAIFALRTPLVDLNSVSRLGWGVLLWFGVDNIDEYYREVRQKTNVVREMQDTPFGKTFLVADPDGYVITIQQK